MHGIHAFTIVVALAARRNRLRELDKCDNARGKRAAKRKRTKAVYHRKGYSMMTDLFSMRTAYREFLQADITKGGLCMHMQWLSSGLLESLHWCNIACIHCIQCH